MPGAKTKDQISTSNGVLNLSGQPGAKYADTSMLLMVVNKDTQNSSSSNPAPITDSPLNLVMNTKHSKETLGLRCTTIAKKSLPSQKYTSDISFLDPMIVPKNPANKLNYFPKTVSNFQGGPANGHFLQRIGPFQYNSASSGTPLVALVNPTATSVIPQSLKPVFTAPSSIPNVETMNQIVYNSMPPAKANMTPHPSTPVILVRSSTTLSKSGNFQYAMTPTEKSSTSFPKSAPQTIFGNESGKFIPVATIVPNNASLVTSSQKTVTSVLSGEPILSTTDYKYPELGEGRKSSDSNSVESKLKCPNMPWYQDMNNSMGLQQSSSENLCNATLNASFSVSQPLNLTSKPSQKNINFTDMMCNQKYSSGKPLLPPGLVFQPSSSTPSPIIFNSAAYSLPNQNVYLSAPPHLNFHKGFSSHLAFGNHMAGLKPKINVGSSQGRSIDLLKSETLSSCPLLTQIAEENAHAMSYEEPPMTLKIDSIFSLADRPDAASPRSVNINQKALPKIKVKKFVGKDKKIDVQRPNTTLSKPRGRRPHMDAKHPIKKRPKPKYKRPTTPLESNHSILSRKASSQKSDITVSCHANDFQSLHPMTEEERKLNTFFKYLGLCPSASITANDACSNNGVYVGARSSANGRCNISKELARCFSCYVVVPMFVPEGFKVVDVNNPPVSLEISNKCSKECRHAFLNKQHTTTGIVPRNGEFDSCWKIIPQTQKCSHARKKYCRKSKTKASGNLTGSHCRRVGCIGCSTKKTITYNSKLKYFRKNSKDNTASGSVTDKEQIRNESSQSSKQGRKKMYTFKKRSKATRSIDSNKDILGTETTCINVLGEKNIPVLRKRKTSQDRHSSVKVLKIDVSTDLENVMGNGEIIESESVDEISPFVSNFLDIDDSCHAESLLMPLKQVLKTEPTTLPQADSSASSERIQRLKEILKEKQKDLEIARQLLL